jgi:hypothetical protein
VSVALLPLSPVLAMGRHRRYSPGRSFDALIPPPAKHQMRSKLTRASLTRVAFTGSSLEPTARRPVDAAGLVAAFAEVATNLVRTLSGSANAELGERCFIPPVAFDGLSPRLRPILFRLAPDSRLGS